MPTPHQGLLVVQHVGQTYRVMQSAFSSRVGHPLPRWRILYSLYELGSSSQKVLAERCRLDPASLTRQLQAMQKLGWIERAVDAGDNRLTNASLTRTGREVVEEALPRRAAFFREMLEGLSEQQVGLLNDALSTLESNAEAASGRGQPVE
ncbi:MarR family transcriptional regulator [Bordetella ansorpii]|uniref:MarR family transcriptional regulator n=1 Tax=Bordetella ansorpii TaxID=288768 RepID=A0A157MDC8_9BORD|nr:MarR family winged helix-turn-helix transcriptional regulator [Bordetella ansorpii]SAI07031.1 MarR family transcriptional regulator [Bordetella ansorpii]